MTTSQLSNARNRVLATVRVPVLPAAPTLDNKLRRGTAYTETCRVPIALPYHMSRLLSGSLWHLWSDQLPGGAPLDPSGFTRWGSGLPFVMRREADRLAPQ